MHCIIVFNFLKAENLIPVIASEIMIFLECSVYIQIYSWTFLCQILLKLVFLSVWIVIIAADFQIFIV